MFIKLTGKKAEHKEVEMKTDLGIYNSIEWQEYPIYVSVKEILSLNPAHGDETETSIYFKNGDEMIVKESIDYILKNIDVEVINE